MTTEEILHNAFMSELMDNIEDMNSHMECRSEEYMKTNVPADKVMYNTMWDYLEELNLFYTIRSAAKELSDLPNRYIAEEAISWWSEHCNA